MLVYKEGVTSINSVCCQLWLGIHSVNSWCPYCDYKTNERDNLDIHIELNHKSTPSPTNEELVDAIEVWKIHKLLQCIKNK